MAVLLAPKFRPMCQTVGYRRFGDEVIAQDKASLLVLIPIFKGRLCLDVRDGVYGLIGLVGDGNVLRANYPLTPLELYELLKAKIGYGNIFLSESAQLRVA